MDPLVDARDYTDLPFPTDGISRIPAGATLRGFVAREDLDHQLDRLGNRKAPGPDELPNELLKTAPSEFRQALLDCLNEILAKGTAPPADWLGGLVRFLPNAGGDPLEPGSYRPVCLQNTATICYTEFPVIPPLRAAWTAGSLPGRIQSSALHTEAGAISSLDH